MHKDLTGNNLKEGFYRDTISGRVVYFIGEYSNGNALTETPYSKTVYTRSITQEWKRINNSKDYLEEVRKDLAFIENKCSRLEKSTKNQSEEIKSFAERNPEITKAVAKVCLKQGYLGCDDSWG